MKYPNSIQDGVTKYEFAVVVVVVAILLSALLSRMPHFQAETERMEVDQTIRSIRIGIQQAIGEHIMTGQEYRIAEVASENPIELLENEPSGYRRGAPQPLQPGEWTYDPVSRQLAYRPRFRETFAGAAELRWAYVPVVDSGGDVVNVRLAEFN